MNYLKLCDSIQHKELTHWIIDLAAPFLQEPYELEFNPSFLFELPMTKVTGFQCPADIKTTLS